MRRVTLRLALQLWSFPPGGGKDSNVFFELYETTIMSVVVEPVATQWPSISSTVVPHGDACTCT